ncbi:MAG: hypothetical protein AB1422_11005 [bacterium]
MAMKVEQRLDNVDRRIERLLKSQEEFRKSQETLKKAQEKTDEQLKKTDEHLKKTDEQLKKTDEQLKKTDEQLKKTDEQLKKTDEELRAMFKKTDKEFEKTRKLVAGISDGWGRLTEGMALVSLTEAFSKRGIKIIQTFPRALSHMNGNTLELDLLSIARGENQDYVIIVEVKTYFEPRDINDALEDISSFYEFFPKYNDLPVIGAIAYMNPSHDAVRIAEKEGFYLLSLKEDTMVLKNKVDFKPKVYKYETKE